MNSYWVRALVALVLAAVLWMQARGVAGWARRERAFQLATGALLAFAALNATFALSIVADVLQFGLSLLGVGLFIGAIALLLLSLRDPQASAQREKFADAAREYRERREQERRQ